MDGEKTEGLRGWLIFVGIGIVISPIRLAINTFPIYFKLFSNGGWTALTTPGTSVYNHLWAPIIIGEIIINIGFIIAWIGVAFLFFSKKRMFPKTYIGILLFSFAFMVLDIMIMKMMIPDQVKYDSEAVGEPIRTIFIIIVWVPYMLLSSRVKETFVK